MRQASTSNLRFLFCRTDSSELARSKGGFRAGTGLALAERVGVIEIDLPEGVRVRVDSGVNEKALRRVLSAVRGLG
jgi:aconitase B